MIRMKGAWLSHQRLTLTIKDRYIILSNNKPHRPLTVNDILELSVIWTFQDKVTPTINILAKSARFPIKSI